MKKLDIISTRANRIDTPDKATGKAVFTDDISKPGMLYGALLQSSHAHAEILSIDTSEAKKIPGVKAVITSIEAGSIKYGVSPARYQDGACIEMQACIAEFDNRGTLTLTTATQVPHYVQRTVAMVLGLDIGKVRVKKPYVGAGFGIKASANPMELSCCILAMETKKPVKMNYTREQAFMFARARHQFTHKITTGAKKDGTIIALKHECYLDGGAYTSFGIATVYYTGSLLAGPYKLENMSYDGYRVYNNKTHLWRPKRPWSCNCKSLF